MPVRIQRKRSKGWRMPENTLYVGRPTKWGNQFPVGGLMTREESVKRFEESLNDWINNKFGYGDSHSFEKFIAPLRGKNLACWCSTGEVCHADVLLRLANKAWSGLVEGGGVLPAEVVKVESVEPA